MPAGTHSREGARTRVGPPRPSGPGKPGERRMSGTWRCVAGDARDHLGILPGPLRTLAQVRHRGRSRGECRRGVHTPRGVVAPRALPPRRRGADRQLHIERSAAAAEIFIRSHKLSARRASGPGTCTEPAPMGRRRCSVLIQGNPPDGGVSRRVGGAPRGPVVTAGKGLGAGSGGHWRGTSLEAGKQGIVRPGKGRPGRARTTGPVRRDNVFNTVLKGAHAIARKGTAKASPGGADVLVAAHVSRPRSGLPRGREPGP